MNILVDNSVWIDFFNGIENTPANKLSHLLSTELVSIGDLILLEVLQGIQNERDFEMTKKYLLDLQYYPLSNPGLAVRAASYHRKLRSKGITVRKTINTMIAAFCIENDFTLLHRDKYFHPFSAHLKLKTFDL